MCSPANQLNSNSSMAESPFDNIKKGNVFIPTVPWTIIPLYRNHFYCSFFRNTLRKNLQNGLLITDLLSQKKFICWGQTWPSFFLRQWKAIWKFTPSLKNLIGLFCFYCYYNNYFSQLFVFQGIFFWAKCDELGKFEAHIVSLCTDGKRWKRFLRLLHWIQQNSASNK